MTDKISEMPIVAEQGSLVLRGDVDEGDLWVCFADWYEQQGSGSLLAVRDWKEISTDRGAIVPLNGSQAQTVNKWAYIYG